ncbi:MAG: alginate O-acetyltransferase complex protein AlgJ [Thermoleophilaceae bacterium]|nr:alginate O-acetyltransferase complex protein AlgJ [Thermoleophilaceae bacterium]
MAPSRQPPDPLAPEEGARARDGARAPQGLKAAVATIALLFFALPLLLGLLGASGGRLAGEPRALRPALSQGWDVFDSGARYLAVNLPGRKRAIRANNWISRELFGTTPLYGVTSVDRSLPSGSIQAQAEPNAARTGGAQRGHPPVFAGLHGWSFLQADLDRNCHRPVAVATALRRWQALVDAIRASGRRVVLLLAPEKSTIYPELLGPHAINGACALRRKADLWSAIEVVHEPDLVGLRRPLLARKRASDEQLYLSVDSHWNDLGAIELATRALEHVGGRARIRFDELVRGHGRYASDLSRFTGETAYATTPTLRIERRGAEDPFVHALRNGAKAVSTVPATHAPMIRGTALFLGDSFGDAPLAMLRHYANRLVSANWQGKVDLVTLVKHADTVILEAVERSFLTLPSGLPRSEGGSILTPKLASRLRLLRDPAAGPDRAAPQR